MTRIKIAELTSLTGVLLLGIGLGAFFVSLVAPMAAAILVIGLVLHGLGMWDKHRLEARQSPQPAWVTGLYWTCWIVLAFVLVGLPFFR